MMAAKAVSACSLHTKRPHDERQTSLCQMTPVRLKSALFMGKPAYNLQIIRIISGLLSA